MKEQRRAGLLIAETGENGEVAWVWIKRKAERIPRPLRRSAGPKLSAEQFDVIGASRGAVLAWLGARRLAA